MRLYDQQMILKTRFSSQSFVKKQDHIVLKEIENEGILLNLKNGHYFVINKIGILIWKLLNGKKSLDEISQRILRRYQGSKTAVLADLTAFVKTLYKQKLVILKN